MRKILLGKKQVLIVAVLVGFIILLSGCVNVKIKDYVDPQAPQKTFKRILVNCIEREMIRKDEAENTIVNNLKAYSMKKSYSPKYEVIPSSKYFFPTRSYSEQQIFDVLKENGFDGYLVVDFRDLETSYSSYTTTDENHFSSTHTQSSDKLSYMIRLMDVESQKCIWTASSQLVPVGAGFNRTIAAMTKEICTLLQQRKFI